MARDVGNVDRWLAACGPLMGRGASSRLDGMSEAVEEALHAADDETALLQVWHAFGARLRQQALEGGADPEIAERALAELPDVSALDALEANRQLIELLTGRRWYVMEAAREAGASWSQIGAVLGMSKQGAQDWYRRKIANQERYASDIHDADRARAAAGNDSETAT